VVGAAAILPIVGVVAHQMGIHAMFLENLGHRVIEGFNRAPTAVQEIVSTGMEFATGGHAREATGIAVVEHH